VSVVSADITISASCSIHLQILVQKKCFFKLYSDIYYLLIVGCDLLTSSYTILLLFQVKNHSTIIFIMGARSA